MATLDVIRLALQAPMDWALFENLAFEILLQDDLPNLRKLGGVGDLGMDAEEEAFYQDEKLTDIVVQVTSQVAQEAKATHTLKRLSEAGIDYRRLIMVYRQPVASPVRMAIQSRGQDSEVQIDVRDETYLVGQLGKPGTGLFARYFRDPATQLDQLLAEGDPLERAPDRFRSAILASIASYVTNPSARMVRTTLFDRTILAVLTELCPTTDEAVVTRAQVILPNVAIEETRVRTSIERLCKSGQCRREDGNLLVSDETRSSLGTALLSIQRAVRSLSASVLASVGKRHRLQDATQGRIERNLRRAVLLLVRTVGPSSSFQAHAVLEVTRAREPLERVLGKELPPEVRATLVAAFAQYVRDDRNINALAILARSYAGLFLWNLDPVGRSWQKATLSRAEIALDTDALLGVLLPDLPTHGPLKTALAALSSDGAKLVIPEDMLSEVVDHVSRAINTYRFHGPSLVRWPTEHVERQILNALVRAFYYHRRAGGTLTFYDYWRQYYDERSPLEKVRFILGKHLDFEILDSVEVRDADEEDYREIQEAVLENKERERFKARFRNETEMEARVRTDVSVALYLAQPSESGRSGSSRGYMVSEDRAFGYMQNLPAWHGRPRVRIVTRTVPSLAEYVCGARMQDEELARLLFSPVLGVAAASMSGEIEALAQVGVDLREHDAFTLEWTLKEGLEKKVTDYQAAIQSDESSKLDRIEAGVELATSAEMAGLDLDPSYADAIRSLREVTAAVEESKADAERMREIARRIVEAAGVTTRKGRRRINQVLADFGGLDAVFDEDTGDPEQKATGNER